MDAELKAKWVAALRSGEYKQCHYALRDEHGYCCLGVLCEVAGLKISGTGLAIEGDQHGGMGYPSLNKFNVLGPNHEFVTKNDVTKLTFAQIADYIETADFPQGETNAQAA